MEDGQHEGLIIGKATPLISDCSPRLTVLVPAPVSDGEAPDPFSVLMSVPTTIGKTPAASDGLDGYAAVMQARLHFGSVAPARLTVMTEFMAVYDESVQLLTLHRNATMPITGGIGIELPGGDETAQ